MAVRNKFPVGFVARNAAVHDAAVHVVFEEPDHTRQEDGIPVAEKQCVRGGSETIEFDVI